MKMSGEEPVLHDRNRKLEIHENLPLPTAAEVADVSERVDRVQRDLNALTRKR
jgi:hypothetical protein